MFVAVSLFDAALAARIPEIFSTRDPDVTRPRAIRSTTLPLTANAREHHLEGNVLCADIDEQGNVVNAHAFKGRYPSPTDQKTFEDIVRTWKFSPAIRGEKPVRVLTPVLAYYDQPSEGIH